MCRCGCGHIADPARVPKCCADIRDGPSSRVFDRIDIRIDVSARRTSLFCLPAEAALSPLA
jgi:hypothetical protein